jgi:hypothetical protein
MMMMMMMMMMKQRLERRDIGAQRELLRSVPTAVLLLLLLRHCCYVIVILLYYYYYFFFFFSLDGILTAHTIIIAKTMTIVYSHELFGASSSLANISRCCYEGRRRPAPTHHDDVIERMEKGTEEISNSIIYDA